MTSSHPRRGGKWQPAIHEAAAAIALAAFGIFGAGAHRAAADDGAIRLVEIWPGLPPGEQSLSRGEALPTRANENPPATRIAKITEPLLEVYEPPEGKGIGTAVVILPGGGFRYVVRDKEGSEAARWLNGLGISAFVLRYRTSDTSELPAWQRPVQDAQRSLRLLRAQAAKWKVDPRRIGLLGFSAGGQVAARVTTHFDKPAYARRDKIDETSCRPDFSLLIYPWNLWDAGRSRLIDGVDPGRETPPTFLVHAHDDSSSSLGSVYFYAALKAHDVPAELHVYRNGGHGYGLRPVEGSDIHTWPLRAAGWLARDR